MTDRREGATAAQLLWRIGARLRQRMSASFSEAFTTVELGGLTPHQARIIGFIEAQEGSGVNQRDLAEATGTRPATISSQLQGLERGGWIVREVDPRDSRRKTLHVTDRGRALVRQFQANVWSGVDLDLSPLTSDERGEFIRLLTILDTHLAP